MIRNQIRDVAQLKFRFDLQDKKMVFFFKDEKSILYVSLSWGMSFCELAKFPQETVKLFQLFMLLFSPPLRCNSAN